MLRPSCLIPLLVFGLFLSAVAQTPADTEPLEEVVVSGEFPGPGMWKVSRADGAAGHVLWIVGSQPPMPKGMKWKTREVEAVARRAQEILLDASVSMQPDEKIGVFRGLSLLPAALKARKNPEEATLRELLPPDLYARWLVQKKRFLGRDSGVEEWRPIFAATKLRKEAVDDLGLRESGTVRDVVGKLAKQLKIKETTPSLRFTFHTDDLKTKLKEFSHQRLADTECFATTLDLTEALSDTAMVARRARAWATGDLATLESLPALPNPNVSCAIAVLESEAAKGVLPADLREQIVKLWMDAAANALETNETTLAVVPLDKLTRKGGYLAQLRARGYVIEAPK